MVLIDYNQMAIAALMQQFRREADTVMDGTTFRYVILSSLLHFKTKFSKAYGDIVICADHHKSWRRDVFKYYKRNRKTSRAASQYDWDEIHAWMETVLNEIRENFPYKVISVEKAEADDIIAILSRTFSNKEEILIVSSDKDFLQLQKYPGVRQWSTMQKSYIEIDNPQRFLKEHILSGDDGDGIPNFLSADNVFVEPELRQTSLYNAKKIIYMDQAPEEFCTTKELMENYIRNKTLIDFDEIPQYIVDAVIREYDKPIAGNRMKIMNYFIKNRLRNLTEDIGAF